MTPQLIFVKPVRYEIPAFQRPYIWTQTNQWEPLWEDVSNLAATLFEENNSSAHFMGAVVFQQRGHASANVEIRIVVDGQQRLTTLQLLIDAIQEILERREYARPAKRLFGLVENDESYCEDDDRGPLKIWPTINDREAFRHVMSNELPADNYRDTSLARAHAYFSAQAELWLDSFPDEEGQRLKAAEALERVVRNYLELVVIDLGEKDDPHVIFETLNARGTPLLPSDMIKNKILYTAGIPNTGHSNQQARQATKLWRFHEDWWREMVGRGHQRRPRIDIFLNNWLTLRNCSETKAHDEFRVFSSYADNLQERGETIESIAFDMGMIGEIFRDVDQRRRTDIGTFLYRRNVMNVGAITPLLLWLLSSEVPHDEISRSLQVLDSFLVRRVICGMSARGYGRLFVRLISELQDQRPKPVDQVISGYLGRQTAAVGLWPSDDEILNRFLETPLYSWLTRGRLRMILEGIEDELRTEMAETSLLTHDLHIEHVLPQAWQQYWPLSEQTADMQSAVVDRERAIHTIGNLTLVKGKLNSALSNAPWPEKKRTLEKHSVLFLNKDLLTHAPELWNEQAITQRAKRMHKAAIRVWPHAATFVTEL